MEKKQKVKEVKQEKVVKQEKKIMKEKKHIKWDKVKEFMKKNSILQYVLIGFAVFALAVIFTAQLNTVNRTDETIQGKREAELKDDITALKVEYEELKEENEKNLKIVEEYKTNASDNNTLINSMTEDLNKMGALSGLKTVKGEGIIITMNDSDMSVSETISTESMLIHDTDLRAIVNELNAAGAEAISINGQRVIASTAIRCVGPVIQVNGVKIATPFYVKAIGNAKYLESALNIKGGIVDSLKLYGIGITLSRENSIQIDKYDGKTTFKYAKIVEE